jgi:hypothetical protein
MTTLYLSTDAFEAETFIEDPDPGVEPNHEYHEFTMESGAAEAKRVGFNPMSAVVLREGTHANEVEKAIAAFHRRGIFVTLVADDGKVEKVFPKDLQLRRTLVTAALRRGFSLYSRLKDFDGDLDSAGRLLRFSNSLELE